MSIGGKSNRTALADFIAGSRPFGISAYRDEFQSLLDEPLLVDIDSGETSSK